MIDILTVVISSLAFLISWRNFRWNKKQDGNVLVKMFVLSNSLERTRHSVEFNFIGMNFIPGQKDAEREREFLKSVKLLEKKIEEFHDLLLVINRITKPDIIKILNNLEQLEENLIDLCAMEPTTSEEVFGDSQAFINPMIKAIEIIQATIVEYENEDFNDS